MFNPNFITRVVTTLAILPISLGAPQAAEASTRCHNVNGFTVCTTDRGHYGMDTINVYRKGNNVASMSVVCTGGGGNTWNANRDRSVVSYQDLKTLAGWWCNNY